MAMAEAGWYDDGSGKHRWWDGSRWTEQFVDFSDPDLAVRTDSRPVGPTVGSPGWFDDGRGRDRWWDGRVWTARTRFGADAREYGGVVVDGRWIHFGDASVQIKDVVAVVVTADALRKRPSLRDAVLRKSLRGPDGPVSARVFGRVDPRTVHLAIEAPGQLWVSPVRAGEEAAATGFATWANSSAQHYRYRD